MLSLCRGLARLRFDRSEGMELDDCDAEEREEWEEFSVVCLLGELELAFFNGLPFNLFCAVILGRRWELSGD